MSRISGLPSWSGTATTPTGSSRPRCLGAPNARSSVSSSPFRRRHRLRSRAGGVRNPRSRTTRARRAAATNKAIASASSPPPGRKRDRVRAIWVMEVVDVDPVRGPLARPRAQGKIIEHSRHPARAGCASDKHVEAASSLEADRQRIQGRGCRWYRRAADLLLLTKPSRAGSSRTHKLVDAQLQARAAPRGRPYSRVFSRCAIPILRRRPPAASVPPPRRVARETTE